MPDRMPEDMPDRMPEDMSDRIPEDLPVTKCINVMVGITRSKVVFIFRALLTLGFHLFNEHFTGFHLLLAEPLARHGRLWRSPKVTAGAGSCKCINDYS